MTKPTRTKKPKDFWINFEGHQIKVHFIQGLIEKQGLEAAINVSEKKILIDKELPETMQVCDFLHEIMEECYWELLANKEDDHDKLFEPYVRRVFGILKDCGFINKNFFKRK